MVESFSENTRISEELLLDIKKATSKYESVSQDLLKRYEDHYKESTKEIKAAIGLSDQFQTDRHQDNKDRLDRILEKIDDTASSLESMLSSLKGSHDRSHKQLKSADEKLRKFSEEVNSSFSLLSHDLIEQRATTSRLRTISFVTLAILLVVLALLIYLISLT